MMDAIEKNVRETIKKMKADGNKGASLDCLFQNTSTRGVSVPVARYRSDFEVAAKKVAKEMRFPLI